MPAWLDRALPTVRAEVDDFEDTDTATEPTRTPVGV
jgi:hypothetical protein